jgi:hypothetical protein
MYRIQFDHGLAPKWIMLVLVESTRHPRRCAEEPLSKKSTGAVQNAA